MLREKKRKGKDEGEWEDEVEGCKGGTGGEKEGKEWKSLRWKREIGGWREETGMPRGEKKGREMMGNRKRKRLSGRMQERGNDVVRTRKEREGQEECWNAGRGKEGEIRGGEVEV